MWEQKAFRTQLAMQNWIEANEHKYQIQVIFINNGYAVTYKPLRRIA